MISVVDKTGTASHMFDYIVYQVMLSKFIFPGRWQFLSINNFINNFLDGSSFMVIIFLALAIEAISGKADITQ